MKWLLDTNVVSETGRARPDSSVLAWLSARAPDQLAISIVTLAELRDGAASAASEARRNDVMQWIDTHVVPAFFDRTLPVTIDILLEWLKVGRAVGLKGKPRAAPDTLLAATARVHDLILVSRNVRDFSGTGVAVFDPWAGKTHDMSKA